MYKLSIFLFLITALGCKQIVTISKQNNVNTVLQNARDSSKMLLGQCNMYRLQQAPFSSWFLPNYTQYLPNNTTIQLLQKNVATKQYQFEIFLGTWCGDSKREVPRILKTLILAGIDTSNIRLIMVNNSNNAYKQSPQHEEKGKYIFRVPTCLIYSNKKYIGRLIEKPIVSVEEDILTIIQQQPYTPNYAAAHLTTQTKAVENKLLAEKELQHIQVKIEKNVSNAFELYSLAHLLYTQRQHWAAINVLTINTYFFAKDERTLEELIKNYTALHQKSKATEVAKLLIEINAANLVAKNLLSNDSK